MPHVAGVAKPNLNYTCRKGGRSVEKTGEKCRAGATCRFPTRALATSRSLADAQHVAGQRRADTSSHNQLPIGPAGPCEEVLLDLIQSVLSGRYAVHTDSL